MTTRSPLPQLDRSQLAQHNDDTHGYWLSIDQHVYDVTEFMHSHPGGARILQLYAGRDATHGFERVHASRLPMTSMLGRCRIGALQHASCVGQPQHAEHCAAYHALDCSLALAVEMQNALTADHSFQLEPVEDPPRRSRYELQRGVETHARFQREYLGVLMSESLPQLAASISPERDVRVQLEHLSASPERVRAEAWALEHFEHFERFANDALTVRVACFEVCDSWLLRVWKRELSRAMRCLERPHAATSRPTDFPHLNAVCDRLFEHLTEYFRNASR